MSEPSRIHCLNILTVQAPQAATSYMDGILTRSRGHRDCRRFGSYVNTHGSFFRAWSEGKAAVICPQPSLTRLKVTIFQSGPLTRRVGQPEHTLVLGIEEPQSVSARGQDAWIARNGRRNAMKFNRPATIALELGISVKGTCPLSYSSPEGSN